MQEIIREPIKKAGWREDVKEKVNVVAGGVSRMVGLFGKGGRFGISWQVANKEFFIGVSMQTIEIERVIKVKSSVLKLHQGEGRVVDL